MVRRNTFIRLGTFLAFFMLFGGMRAKDQPSIPAGSKVYIAQMGGFDTYFKAALESKKVPLEVVEKKEDAAYEITGTSSSEKAGAAKKILLGSWHSKEEASIQVSDLKTGVIVFAYSYHTENSAHGKRTSAESCAKHLKDAIKSQ